MPGCDIAVFHLRSTRPHAPEFQAQLDALNARTLESLEQVKQMESPCDRYNLGRENLTKFLVADNSSVERMEAGRFRAQKPSQSLDRSRSDIVVIFVSASSISFIFASQHLSP